MGSVVCQGACVSACGLKCVDVELSGVDSRDEGTVVDLCDCSLSFKRTSQRFSALNPLIYCVEDEPALFVTDPGSGFSRTGVAVRKGSTAKLRGVKTAGASVGLLVQNACRSCIGATAISSAESMSDAEGGFDRSCATVEAVACHFSSGAALLRCDKVEFWADRDIERVPQESPAFVNGNVHGVAVYGARSNVFVYDCVSEGSQIAGFWVQERGKLLIEGEIFCLSGGEWVGCGVRGSHTTLVARNLAVQSCHNNGVIVFQGARARLQHCRIEDCRVNAMHACVSQIRGKPVSLCFGELQEKWVVCDSRQ